MTTAKRPAVHATMPELLEALSGVLASDYEGVRSGRIRDLPDARTIRWYQTRGMVDRPAALRGRTGLYGRRHLLQLAAIKKLQSSGFSLADIQRGLAGRNDEELARSAGVTLKVAAEILTRCVLARSRAVAAELAAAVAGSSQQQSRGDTTFWKAKPADALPPAPVVAGVPGMQSAGVGDAGLLLWSGRALTAAEQETLARLAAPLARFLETLRPSIATAKAEGGSRAASAPRRPTKGVRP